MNTRKAKIAYCHDFNGQEGYKVEIFNDVTNEFEFNAFYPLIIALEDGGNGSKNYVHYFFINEISRLQQLGYEIKFTTQEAEG